MFTDHLSGLHFRAMFKIPAIALPLVGWATMALADITLDFEIEADGEKHQIRMSIAGDRLRFDAAQGSTIITPKEPHLLMLFHGTRTYVAVKQDTLLSGLGELPQPKTDRPATLKRTGERQSIGGFECEKVIFEEPGGATEELWLSPKAPPMSLAMGPARRSLDGLGIGFAQKWKHWVSAHPDLANIPVRSISRGAAGRELQRTTLTGFNTNSLPAETFAVPSHYAKQEMPLFEAPNAAADDIDASMQKLDDAIKRLDQELKKLEGDNP